MKKKIYNFTAVFERNEHDGYTVVVPSLPGLVTEGKNLDDAKKMATEAIQCYLEGLKVDRQKVPVEGDIASLRLSVSF
ncbi:MAG: type II toxin-antitoxin system HicB family antitoxin [Candidatus Taylorbacteria bacterium]